MTKHSGNKRLESMSVYFKGWKVSISNQLTAKDD